MKEILKQFGEVEENASLKKYTSYRLQGTADFVVTPKGIGSLLSLLKCLKEKQIPYQVIGGGSNLIFSSHYKGVLISTHNFQDLEIDGNNVIVGAGYSLIALALKMAKLGYTELEFATGIPGTVGGAVYNNSGAYKSDMGQVVKSILVITPDLEIKRMYNRDLDFKYRSSYLKDQGGYICLEVSLSLKEGYLDTIEEIIENRKKRRQETQPLNYPSAGSVFRNPEGNYAGRLIEEIGFKGKKIGGAKISDKHANFIINDGNATGEDIIKLIDETKKKVKEVYNIELILEQEIIK